MSEGALNWTIAPWLRRLVTRTISIIPSIIIAGAVGKNGLTAAMNGSQVALSVALPFLSLPIIYFTCRNKYMLVRTDRVIMLDDDSDADSEIEVSAIAPAPVAEAENVSTGVAQKTDAEQTVTMRTTKPTRHASTMARIASFLPASTAVEAGTDLDTGDAVSFRNHWISTIFAVLVWLLICVMNVTNLVLVGMDK